MRTLHVDTGREMGGGQWQALYLMERLPDATLLTPPESRLFGEAQKRRLAVHPLNPITLARLARRADLVHAHDARAHTWAAMAGFAPLLVSRRVGFPVKRTVMSRWKYARPVRYLAVSRFVATRLAEAGVPEERIRVVYDGVPIPAPSARAPGRVIALANKCIEVAGIPVHRSTDLWQDLSTASIFIYASAIEGLGSAALAAMAAGVPVVASRAGGLPEAVEHGRTGLVVSDGEFAAAIRRLLDDPVTAAEMGRRGRERVQERFTVEAMVHGTLAVYEEALRQC